MLAELSIFTVVAGFGLGFVSFFLSLCILPLIPAFLTYLAGSSLSELKENPTRARRQIFLNSIAFALGLALFFSVLGVLLQSVLLSQAYLVQTWLSYFFGALIIFFGLLMTGLVKVHALEREQKFVKISPGKKSLFQSFLFGGAFAVGWTPCTGPFLGSVLSLAVTQPAHAFPLLFSYALGIALPFVILGAFISKAKDFLDRLAPHMQKLNFVFGLLFIALGILVFTGRLVAVFNMLIPEDLVGAIGALEGGI